MGSKTIWKRFSFWQAVVFSLAFLLFFIFEFYIEKEFSKLIVFPIHILIIIAITFSLSISIFSIFPNIKHGANYAIPALINFMVIIIVVLIPFKEIQINNDFEEKLSNRNVIVNMVLDNKLLLEKNGSIDLPEKYKYLSKDGNIMVGNFNNLTFIYFYEDRGLLENSYGYAYLSDEIYLDNSRDIKLNLIKDYGNGWYYCSTY